MTATPGVATVDRPAAPAPPGRGALPFPVREALIPGLVLLSPLLVVLSIAIWFQDYHSPFYVAPRMGRGEKPFRMVKFRSMVILADASGVDSTAGDDPRITSLGRFIRRFKLDEIPQLWNVVRGDMNLVGPRPVRPVFLEEFVATIPGYARRFAMKPGLTGVAQLRGGYFTTPAAKLRYELWYLRERSVSLDLAILTLTGVKLLNRWITLGGLLFALFVFVSFMPSGILGRPEVEKV